MRETGDRLCDRAASEPLTHRRYPRRRIRCARRGSRRVYAGSTVPVPEGGSARGLEPLSRPSSVVLTDQHEIEIADWLSSPSMYDPRLIANQVCDEVRYRFSVHIHEAIGRRLLKTYRP
jgi:hypothetical protein